MTPRKLYINFDEKLGCRFSSDEISCHRVHESLIIERRVMLNLYTFEYHAFRLTLHHNFAETRGTKCDNRHFTHELIFIMVGRLRTAIFAYQRWLAETVDHYAAIVTLRKLRIDFYKICDSGRFLSKEISCHRVHESLILQCRVMLNVYTSEYHAFLLTLHHNFGETQATKYDTRRTNPFSLWWSSS